MSPIIVISTQIIKTGFLTQSPVSSLSCQSIISALSIPYLEGLMAAAESAWAGLLPGQTLPGQLRKIDEMLGDTALQSSGGLHILELPGNKYHSFLMKERSNIVEFYLNFMILEHRAN